MSWNRIGAIAVLVLIVGAFLVGRLPERNRRLAAEEQSRLLQGQLGSAEARVRLGELLGEVLNLKEVAMRQNYGEAQTLSSRFFDRVRQTATEAQDDDMRDALTEVLTSRDSVTASLAKANSAVVEAVHIVEVRLRRALGYPVPSVSQN